MLFIFAGLPATGKSTIAKALAESQSAIYLRIDSIEQSLRDSGLTNDQIGGLGYQIACAVATDNLATGNQVVIDSVNPWQLTRDMYRKVATDLSKPYVDIEVVCSDSALHRSRAETRSANIPGHKLPTWQEIESRDYHPWDTEPLRIDTAITQPAEAVKMILELTK